MNYEEFDLEVDLKNSELIKKKVQDDNYAQNLYAALCNVCWQPIDIMSILIDDYWSSSWRHSGGIVAELRNKGEDHIDFYCSGIVGEMSPEERILYKFVEEGTVTEEIREDIKNIGWREFKPQND